MSNPPALPPPRNNAWLRPRLSVLAWPAWLRMLAIVPAVALLWLAVFWAHLEAATW